MRIKEVGVIFGGRSGEHEVSLASAASVIRALDPEQIRSRAHRHHQRRPMARGNARRKRCCRKCCGSGQRVMLSADPNVAALIAAR